MTNTLEKKMQEKKIFYKSNQMLDLKAERNL